MLVPVPPEHCAEEGGAGRENDFVGLQLLVVAGQGHVEEVFVLSQLPKCTTENISYESDEILKFLMSILVFKSTVT